MAEFFVSYNQADRPWAEWIASLLEDNGYTTVIQAWDFRGNFVLEMDKAAREAERTIAVLSTAYTKFLFTNPEWASAFAQDPTSEKGKLIPVRVEDIELKGLLAQINYVDFVSCDEQTAKEMLLARVKGERLKPSKPSGFPGYKPPYPTSDRTSGGHPSRLPVHDRPLILFAQNHGQGAWTTSGGPVIDSGYLRAHEALREHFEVERLDDRISRAALRHAACLVFPVSPMGKSFLQESELDEIDALVKNNKGLLLMGIYAGDQHHGANLNKVALRYGLCFNPDVVLPADATELDARGQVYAGSESQYVVTGYPDVRKSPSKYRKVAKRMTEKLKSIKTVSSCSIGTPEGMPIIFSTPDAVVMDAKYGDERTPPIHHWVRSERKEVAIVAASTVRKVVAVGSWKTFLNGFIDDHNCGNDQLIINTLGWLCGK